MRRLTLALPLLWSLAASAAGDPFARGIDLVPVKVTPTMNSGLTLDGAELREHRSWQLRALLDLNLGILALKLGDQRLGDLVPLRLDLHLLGAWQLHPRIEVAADLPFTVGQVSNFKLLDQQGFPQTAPNAAGIGAPRLLGRVQILRQSDVMIGNAGLLAIAAVLEVRIPLPGSSTFSFLSDRGFVFAPRVAVERDFGPLRVLANVGWRLRTAPGQYLNLLVGQEFMMGAGAIVALPDAWKFRQNRLVGEVNLVTPAEAPFTFAQADSLKSPFEATLGVTSQVANHWNVMLGFGKGLGANGYGRETFRVMMSVSYEVVAEPDRDGDGIPDRVDQCPDVPEDLDGYQDDDGCPEEGPEKDTDGDGVPDKVDACPDKPGPVELDGCPDRDKDQIPDNVDKCPDVPGEAQYDGCPPPEEEEPVTLESERIRIRNQIQYEFGSAKIDPRSYPMLDEVAKVLSTNPDVGPVLIEGHTDNVGTRAYNLDLSKRRAKSVEDYLLKKGIAPKRLRSDGFGFDKPLVPNDSALNRAKNRRTEFRLVEEEEGKDKGKGGKGAKDGKGGGKPPGATTGQPAGAAARPAQPAPAPAPAAKPDAGR